MNKRIKELESRSSELGEKINLTGGRYEQEKKSMEREYQEKVRELEKENKRVVEINS